MAAKREAPRDTKVYHPDGFAVKVTKGRAEALLKRGYTKTKPKPAEPEPSGDGK